MKRQSVISFFKGGEFLLLLFFLSFFIGSFAINFCYLILFIFLIINRSQLELDKLGYLILTFFIYIIFSSIFLKNINYIINSILLIKFLILFFSIQIILKNISEKKLKYIFNIFLFIILFLIVDIFFQKFFGEDIFGFPTKMGERLTGPYDDIIISSLLLFFGLHFIFYFSMNNIKFGILFFAFYIISVFITGARINFLSLILASILIFLITSSKRHLFTFILSLLICFIIFQKDSFLKHRYITMYKWLNPKIENFPKDELKSFKQKYKIETNKEIKVNFFDNAWGVLYLNAYKNFKARPVIGNGIKSFRDLCSKNDIKKIRYSQKCSSHPHNLHLEILSETGLVGYFIFLIMIISIFCECFYLFKKKKITTYNKKIFLYFFYSSLILLFILIFPVKSSGRIFSTFFGSIFWLHFSLTWFLMKRLKLGY